MVLSHALLLHDVGKDRVDFRIFQDKHTERQTGSLLQQRAAVSGLSEFNKGFNIYYINIPSGLSCEALSRWLFEYYFNPLESAAQEVCLTEPREHT